MAKSVTTWDKISLIKLLGVLIMVARTDAKIESKSVKRPPSVTRGLDSQKLNETGIHWLRMSFSDKKLNAVKEWVSNFYGKTEEDARGLWGYTNRMFWASGAALFYDSDPQRSETIHRNRVTLEMTGRVCDRLSSCDLQLFVEGCRVLDGRCSRIDIFFDDYDRVIAPCDLHEIIDRGDFSGFRKWKKLNEGLKKKGIDHDEVSFGRRGQKGGGKYLRIYDKNLESDGDQNCIRWEVEFSGEKAHGVFNKLAACGGDSTAFATICGALVGGSINFVHYDGEKNLNRLDVYDFWQKITGTLGRLRIRTIRKPNDVVGMTYWIERAVTPTLACLRKVFKNDQEFFGWLLDILKEGDSRMMCDDHKLQIATENRGIYDRGLTESDKAREYLSGFMCDVLMAK